MHGALPFAKVLRSWIILGGSLAVFAAAIPASALTTDLVTRTTISAHIPVNGYNYPVLGASADGRFAVFGSIASNLVANDTNHAADIFVYDASSATIERVSIATDGTQGNADIDYGYDISADGRYVVFASFATNLVAGSVAEQVYLRDRQAGTTSLLSVNKSGMPGSDNSYLPRLSGDGHYAAFISCAHDLIAGDTSTTCNVYRRDLWANATELVSVGIGSSNPDGNSSLPSLSTDGRYVAFQSSASNLVVADSNGKLDVFVRDMASQSIVRASVNSAGGQLASSARLPFGQSISGDGRYVNFQTNAQATPADLNPWPDVYVRDLVTNSTILVSVTPGGAAGDFFSYAMSIAADGTVLFASDANDLAGGSNSNLYVYTPGASPAVSALWNGAASFYADYAGTYRLTATSRFSIPFLCCPAIRRYSRTTRWRSARRQGRLPESARPRRALSRHSPTTTVTNSTYLVPRSQRTADLSHSLRTLQIWSAATPMPYRTFSCAIA